MDKKLSITLEAFVDDAVRKTVDAANSMVKGLTQMKDSFVQNFKDAQLASGAFLYGFQKMARDFLETTATFERVGVMAKFLTQDAEEARKFTDALIDMSVKTMFSTQQITELGTRILGQTRDIEKTKKMMWGLTEAVAATGGTELDLQNAQRALTQTFIKAHPALEELNKQFNNANIPVFRVLAEAISNNIVKLEGYTSSAGVTGGASKKLAAANQKALDSFQQTVWRSEAAEKALKRLTNKYGENSEQVLRQKATVDSYHQKLDKLQGTMKDYNEAQANMGKTASVAHKSVEQIMADLQNPDVLKGIKGQDAAIAISEALMWKFTGANEAMLSTWSGMVRNIKDVLDLLKISIFGLEKDLSIREGSIFYWLHLGAKRLSDYLLANRENISNFFDGLMKNKDALLVMASVLISLLLPVLIPIISRMATFVALAMVLSPLIYAILSNIQPLVEWWRSLDEGIKKFIETVGGLLVPALTIAFIAMKAFGVSILGLLNPISLAVLAIITLITIGVWLVANWEHVRAVAMSTWELIKAIIHGKVTAMQDSVKAIWLSLKLWLQRTWGDIQNKAGEIWENIANTITDKIKKLIDWFQKAIDKASEFINRPITAPGIGMPSQQHGGVVPGAIGQPIPILAHGGERIVPRGGSSQFANMGTGTGITINMTGTVVLDSEDRVREMADRIIRILGRQNELARYGTGYSFI